MAGTRQLTAEQFEIPVDRICKVKSIILNYYSSKNAGLVMSYTIESQTSNADAVVRSPPLLISQFPRRYTLRNPASTDYAYIVKSDSLCDITIYNSDSSVTGVHTYLLATIVMQFNPKQPSVKDLGMLPPRGAEAQSPGSSFSYVTE